MELLQTLEQSRYAMFVKESGTAYTACLALHTIGLVFLVGISGGTALRVLGVARGIPLAALEDFFPLAYAGFWINAVTGVVLLSLYPTKYVVDPTIYIKLAAVALAMVALRSLRARVFGVAGSAATPAGEAGARRPAILMIAAWTAAVVAGRVTAYTVETKIQTALAVIVFAAVSVLIGWCLMRGGFAVAARGSRRPPVVH